MAKQSDYDTEKKLGDCDSISSGRIDDRDSQLGCSVERDVVNADAGATHDHEARRRVEYRRGHFCFAAHDERVDVRDAREEVRLFQTGGLPDLAARAEQRETLFGKRVRDVNDVAAISDESRPRRSPAVRSTRRGLRDATPAAGSPRTRAAPRSWPRLARWVGSGHAA